MDTFHFGGKKTKIEKPIDLHLDSAGILAKKFSVQQQFSLRFSKNFPKK